jgi:hypothetical protein
MRIVVLGEGAGHQLLEPICLLDRRVGHTFAVVGVVQRRVEGTCCSRRSASGIWSLG